jgi:hypothetical protein
VHAAKPAAAKSGVAASVGKSSITEAGAAEPSAVKSAEPTAVEPAEPTTAERQCVIYADGKANADRRACQQYATKPLSVRVASGHRRSPDIAI